MNFKKKLGEKGTLYWTYKDPDEFTNLVRMHLSRQVQDWNNSWGTETAREVSTNESDMTESVTPVSEEGLSLEEEEVGLLDLIEQGLDGFENASHSAERMTEASLLLGHKIEAQTAELEHIRHPPQREDIRMVKHIIENASLETHIPHMMI